MFGPRGSGIGHVGAASPAPQCSDAKLHEELKEARDQAAAALHEIQDKDCKQKKVHRESAEQYEANQTL